MIPLLTFSQRYQDALPSCPIPLLNTLVVEAARELCQAGRLWKAWIPTATIVDGTSDYDLTAGTPANTTVVDLAQVLVGGKPILPYDVDATTPATDQAPYNGAIPGTGTCFNDVFNVTYNRDNDTTITLVPVPSGLSGYSLDVQLVLVPQLGNTSQLPDQFYNEWNEAIEHYVKWRAMMRQKEKFSDPQMAQYHYGEWMIFRGRCVSRGRAGKMSARRRSVPSDFG